MRIYAAVLLVAATVTDGDIININGREVRIFGLAIALRPHGETYFASEADAKQAGRGIWNSSFETSREWRRGHAQ